MLPCCCNVGLLACNDEQPAVQPDAVAATIQHKGSTAMQASNFCSYKQGTTY